MENLWKTNESGASTSNYVDIFAISEQKFGLCFSESDDDINVHVEQLKIVETISKCNQMAKNLLVDGHADFESGNFRTAMEKYNKSLSFAEFGTKWESLAYELRAACFMKMEKYAMALTDIRLALKFKHTGRTLLRLNAQLAKCHRRLICTDFTERLPEVNFPLNKDFPCMADVLEVRESKEFGRHIVAKCDIEVGKVVMISEIFAAAAVSDTLTCCRICTKVEQNFIACTECSNAMFCLGTCADRIRIHRLECGTIFHQIDTGLKLPIQTILMALDMFPNINDLMEFVERYINNNGNGVPKVVNDAQSRYELFLALIRCNSSDCIYLAYRVFTTILTFPHVQRLINTEKKKRFFAHLTLHHVTVMARNSFEHEKKDIGIIKMDYIYDVLSLFNHSCAPNLFNVSRPDDVTYCITIKPIWAGEQVFIDYLGNSSTMTLKQRQSYLLNWDFRCNCERCQFEKAYKPSPMKAAIESDPAYQYVISTCQEKDCKVINWKCGKRKILKQKCVQFLGKFGHIAWTPEIHFVVHCLTLH